MGLLRHGKTKLCYSQVERSLYHNISIGTNITVVSIAPAQQPVRELYVKSKPTSKPFKTSHDVKHIPVVCI